MYVEVSGDISEGAADIVRDEIVPGEGKHLILMHGTCLGPELILKGARSILKPIIADYQWVIEEVGVL